MLGVAVEKEARKRRGTRGLRGKIVLKDRKGRMVRGRKKGLGGKKRVERACEGDRLLLFISSLRSWRKISPASGFFQINEASLRDILGDISLQ